MCKMQMYGGCDIGQMRMENQDRILMEPIADGLFAVVCDGMGGMQNGSEASTVAIAAAADCVRQGYQPQMQADAICELLRAAAIAANQAVFLAAHAQTLHRMGTTLVGAFLRGSLACLVNVGDSRAYRIPPSGPAQQLTIDHTVVQLLYERGEITADMRVSHPRRNELTRAIGVSSRVLADSHQLTLRTGENLLLCSDGLYGLLRADGIADTVRACLPDAPERVPQQLIDAANANGGNDNISAILLLPACE